MEFGEAAAKNNKSSNVLFLHRGICPSKLARIFYLVWLDLNFQIPALSLRLFQFFVISSRTAIVQDSYAREFGNRFF